MYTSGYCGKISKAHLIAALTANIFDSGSVRADKLVGLLTDKPNKNTIKKSIWGKNYAGVDAGKIHGLVLMLIASKLITLGLTSKSLVGAKKVETKHVLATLTKCQVDNDNGCHDNFAIHDNTKWKGFQFAQTMNE